MPDHHDEWYTQLEDYANWQNTYDIMPNLDVAASDKWHMEDHYYTKKDDALKQQWLEDFWLNPPLLGGLTKKFVLYAWDEAFKHKVNGLCCIPAGVIARQWFRPIWKAFREDYTKVLIDPINRPSFHDHGKPIEAQARNDYIMLVLRGR